jgi:hypothetical protein
LAIVIEALERFSVWICARQGRGEHKRKHREHTNQHDEFDQAETEALAWRPADQVSQIVF